MVSMMILVILCIVVLRVQGHGSMVEPPSRGVMHFYGFPSNPPNYNWMEGFCGGKAHQWGVNGGKCGVCGDSWDAEVKDHEAPGGKYANGVIVRQYRPGQIIRVTSHITANHAGFVDFKLCRNNNINQDPTQDCFDLPEASLAVVEAGHVSGSGGHRLMILDEHGYDRKVTAHVKLPDWECSQCILQWTYRNGRDWGTCNGACGEVEMFRNCADIAIMAEDSRAAANITGQPGQLL